MSNYDIKFDVININDAYFATTPVPANAVVLLHQVPLVPNQRHELMSVHVVCMKTLAVDANDTVLVDTITCYDASAVADVSTKLLTGGAGAAGDLKVARLTLKIPDALFLGQYSLDRGDSVRAILATVTPDTAGVGYFFVVGSRIAEYNGEI